MTHRGRPREAGREVDGKMTDAKSRASQHETPEAACLLAECERGERQQSRGRRNETPEAERCT
jgi:hypothetical protein